MTEQEAQRFFDFWQTIHYDHDCVDVYFDVESDNDSISMTEKSQVFYRGANITNLIDWDKVDREIDWKKVKEELRNA
jgi:hypothetical protein